MHNNLWQKLWRRPPMIQKTEGMVAKEDRSLQYFALHTAPQHHPLKQLKIQQSHSSSPARACAPLQVSIWEPHRGGTPFCKALSAHFPPLWPEFPQAPAMSWSFWLSHTHPVCEKLPCDQVVWADLWCLPVPQTHLACAAWNWLSKAHSSPLLQQ